MSSKSSRTGSQVSKLHKTSYAQSGKGEDWLDRLARFNKHFGRFARDVGGVVLLALALMSLLALLRLTKGALLIPWADWLSCWFGWGSYFLVLTVGFGGWFLLRRVGGRPGWGQFIAIELAVFLSMALLDAVFGHSLEWAEAGLYGGRLGWGLVELLMHFLGPIWTLVLVILIWILTFMSGLGLWSWLETRLLTLAGESLPSTVAPPVMDKHIGRSPVAADVHTTKKRVASLPPEFRKSLRAPDSQDQRPAAPIPRGERLPPLTLLVGEQSSRPDERTINQIAGLIEKTLAEFGIPTRVVGFRIGPSVTQFAVEPGFIERSGSVEGDAQRLKVRVAQIASLQRDLALALSAERLRIEAPVPGRSYVGVEVPNSRTSIVRLRPLLETEAFYRINSPLAIALGRDVSGQPVVADLARMPHLLIAGATGSGKSVCITALATCLAMNNTPEDLRLVMIDSKMVELLRFNGLSHLYGKVETDIQRILGVLRWVVVEMEHRYRLLEAARARDIDLYNRRIQRRREGMPLPRIVVMIDEMADLMMSAPDQTEHNLVRLAQMARATGIHLVVATQRPSVDVVTGLIKANFPARASFAVASSVDSRVVLDMAGAENLLGRGDMLFLNPEVGGLVRVQGVMVADQEVERLINHWQKTPPEIEEPPPWEKLLSRPVEEDDSLIEQAISVFRDTQRASASLLQRRLRIGYPRAARLLDQLEELGVVGPSQGGGREREVLVGQDEDNDIEA